jgi:glutathione S-transferase
MPSFKLTYFDFDGGRGEPIRIALHAAGIEFEDERLSFEEFGKMRHSLRFSSLPILTIDGKAVTQSNAISRYIGKMAGMYPEDDLQALYCDEVIDALEDVNHYIVPTLFLQGHELQAAREKLVAGWLSIYLKGLGQLLTRGGDTYFADDRLTVADLKMLVQVRALRSGRLEHVPTDLVDELEPKLCEHQARIEKEPQVVAYYASR